MEAIEQLSLAIAFEDLAKAIKDAARIAEILPHVWDSPVGPQTATAMHAHMQAVQDKLERVREAIAKAKPSTERPGLKVVA